MLDSMFQEGTDKTLDDRVSRPLQAPTARPSFGASLWNTTKAPFAGVGAGANESAGFAADILGAFGQVQAGYGLQADPTLLFSGDEQKKRFDAGQKSRDEIESGAAFSTDIGSGFRATARSFAPDPATANAAEQILFGLGRFGSKAVGYSAAAGPAAGAAIMGADEGMTEADRLKAEGVDINTRTKVGIVAGASSAAAVALPIAGKTLAGTAALVAAGGPASFIAQQAASKSILENAGYDKIAEQYDPFDPVGLAVSTLVPAVFGAHAMRGAKAQPKPVADPAAARALVDMGGNERLALKYDDARLDAYAVTAAQREGIPPEALLAIKNVGEKSGPTAVSPKGAQGVMQFMPDTWKAYGKGDPRDPVASIDAGARYMKDLIKQYDGDVRAAIAHYNGGGKAGAAVKAGEIAPALETRKYLGRTDAFMAERSGTEAGRAAANDPEAVAAARVQLAREVIDRANPHLPDDLRGAADHINAFNKAGDQMAAGERVDVSDTLRADAFVPPSDRSTFNDWFSGSKVAGEDGRPIRVFRGEEQDFGSNAGMWFTSDPVAASAYAEQLKGGFKEGANVTPAYLSLRNPLEVDAKGGHYYGFDFEGRDINTDELAAEAMARGHDGLIVKNVRDGSDGPIATYRALKPEQIKPAIAISGAFERFSAGLDALKPDKSVSKPAISASKGTPPASNATESASVQPAGAPKPAGESSATPSPLDAQTAEIARLSPELMVQLEGMDKPVRLADALEAVKAEAAKEAQDAPLLQVAAECFLRSA